MPHLPETTEPDKWHRYFAIEYNNRAWDLTTRQRTAEEDLELLDAAHAAACHWRVTGNELNQMRATMLLAEAHAQLGFGASALAFADVMKNYFLSHETPDWEVAFTHTIHAHAAAAAGDVTRYKESYAAAITALDAITDADDRMIVQQTFDQVPRL